MGKASQASIAVIGAGLIGQKHIDIVSNAANLSAIVDPNPAAEQIAKSHGTQWFASLETYLERAMPDGAIVATPNQLHLDHARACIEKGVPVLVEKPLAENVASATKIMQASTQAGVPVLVGHHRRHSGLVRAAKAAIEAGQLGRIVVANAQFWLFKPDDYFETSWRRQDGAGPTYINLIHDIDLLRYFCGDIVSVQATQSNRVRGFEVEDSCVVILEFESGALGTVSISDTVSAPWSWELTAGENPVYPKTDMACYTLGGTHGSLSIPDLRLWSHPGKRSWWEPIEAQRLDFTANDPVADQFVHFLDVIENGTVPLVTAAEGLKNMQILDAIKQAALGGKAVINNAQ